MTFNNQPSERAQDQCQICKSDTALQSVMELAYLQEKLGLTLKVRDKNLNNISGKCGSVKELLRNPEFVSRLHQELYISNPTEATWFKFKLRKGRIVSISFLLTLLIKWVQIVNRSHTGFDFIIVGFFPGEENTEIAVAVIPFADFTPERIMKHFPQLVGQTTNSSKETGKILCHILSKYVRNPSYNMLFYCGKRQGFEKNFLGKIQFNPPHLLRDELKPFLPAGLTCRQFPVCCHRTESTEMTALLIPLFEDQDELQLLLLFRIASLFQSFFALSDVYADNTLIVKPTSDALIIIPVAILKNTGYDSMHVPSIGPNIKPLKFDVENINDGMVVVVDPFSADQTKKAEKGYDLLLTDKSDAIGKNNTARHIAALISGYADLYFPKHTCCVLEITEVSTDHLPETFKNTLRNLDAHLVAITEKKCSSGDFLKEFECYVREVKSSIPDRIPRSKVNTFIMLNTAMTLYNAMFSPFFNTKIKEYIVEWLCSQERDQQLSCDVICSEYGRILNQKIADGYFNLILKEEVTPFDKGSHTIVVDRIKHRIYVETADTFAIAKDEMQSVSDADSVTSALYSCEYLPHNVKNEKSTRIAAITSDGVPYPLYAHAIKFTLLNQKNRQRFDLIDKTANLFTYDEMPRNHFLPLVRTVDGRFAGKMLRYEAAENNIYFGTGKSGSGKSWAIAQILPMLFMMGHHVVVFDVSGTYTRRKMERMLPQKVIECLFEFIDIGEGIGKLPVDFGSLKDCSSLPDKKNAIYSVVHAAIGNILKDEKSAMMSFLSEHLRYETDSVNLVELFEMAVLQNPGIRSIENRMQSVLQELYGIGFENRSWGELLAEKKIMILNLGIEVGDSTHQLLDMLVSSLFNWQMHHDSRFLSIAIDELIDQDFSKGSPLSTIVKQGRKFHTALIGATQDYFNQGSSSLDAMKQANIKSFCRPGKSEDHVAEKLGYSNAVDAGFHKFKAGDAIFEFDGYNRETNENEALMLKGRVVDFVDTPLYEKFKEIYG